MGLQYLRRRAKIKPRSLFGDPVVVLVLSTVEPKIFGGINRVILVILMKILGLFLKSLNWIKIGETQNHGFQD